MKGLYMEYNVFLSCIKECVKERCEDTDIVEINKIIKNNSVELDGLIIRKQNCDISPTIYLNRYYDEFLNGKSIEIISDEIVSIDAENRFNIDFEAEKLMNFEYVRDKIMFKLVNIQRNRMLLDMVPHREIEDLALVYYCKISEKNENMATILIYETHRKMWDITEEELYDIAFENTRRELTIELTGMDELLLELVGSEIMDEDMINEIRGDAYTNQQIHPMYVLSNNMRMFGAACIVYDDVLDEFFKKYGEFYILPSSIHEVILIPNDMKLDEKYLEDMVHEVNDTQLSRDEVLSDRIYKYIPGQGVRVIL